MELLISLILLTTNVIADDKIRKHAFFNTFQTCAINKNILYLSKKQKKDIIKRNNFRSVPGVFKMYNVLCKGVKLKVFLLSDLVRTHYQKVFISVKNSKIDSIKIVQFAEPKKYSPPKGFINKFIGKSDFLNIDGLTGATLTRSSLLRISKLAIELDKIK